MPNNRKSWNLPRVSETRPRHCRSLPPPHARCSRRSVSAAARRGNRTGQQQDRRQQCPPDPWPRIRSHRLRTSVSDNSGHLGQESTASRHESSKPRIIGFRRGSNHPESVTIPEPQNPSPHLLPLDVVQLGLSQHDQGAKLHTPPWPGSMAAARSSLARRRPAASLAGERGPELLQQAAETLDDLRTPIGHVIDVPAIIGLQKQVAVECHRVCVARSLSVPVRRANQWDVLTAHCPESAQTASWGLAMV